MKAVIFLALFALSCASPVKEGRQERFVKIQDDHGNIHDVDLHEVREIDFETHIEDISFHLYTQQNMNTDDHFVMEASEFDGTVSFENYIPQKEHVFVIHGYGGDYTSGSSQRTMKVLLEKYDLNVFVADYGRPAKEFYTVSRIQTNTVGRFMAEFIDKLITINRLEQPQIIIIGHSLGGQTAGAVGAAMKSFKPDIIVAQDPAGPLFYVEDPDDSLDPEDAEFVQVVHGNDGGLGLASACGHADFFPNGGGMDQPGCKLDLFGGCAHGRSVDYWVESVAYDETHGFKAWKCKNYNTFLAGDCDGNEVAFMGHYPVDKTPRGKFYLETNAKLPYSIEDVVT